MEKFKLTNLRELSTEEQLRLNGGANSESCSCTMTCSCGILDKQSTDAIKEEVLQKSNENKKN